jgi:hypothetical protein
VTTGSDRAFRYAAIGLEEARQCGSLRYFLQKADASSSGYRELAFDVFFPTRIFVVSRKHGEE